MKYNSGNGSVVGGAYNSEVYEICCERGLECQAKVGVGDMIPAGTGRMDRSATEVDPAESIFQSSSLLILLLYSSSHIYINIARKRGHLGDATCRYSYDKAGLGRTQNSDRR